MARIIIGSSNVRRFYSHTKFNAYQPYKMELCTVNRMFEVTMESIPDEARVIVSVIENFIEKEIKDKDEAGKIKSLEEVMKNFIETVVRVAKKKKDAKFVLAYPLLRPAHKWMIDNDERISREFERAFNRQDQANISKVDCLLKGSQNFEKDGVHLTNDCGQTFLDNLLGMAEDSFEAECIDIEDVAEKIINLGESSKKGSEVSGVAINELRRSATEMREWRDHFERTIDKKFRNDNLMFARLREEMDAEVNRKKEDRTLIAGCVDPALMPKTGKEKNDFLKNLAKEFCKKIIPEFEEEVQFASVSGRPDKGNLMMEFKIGSVEKAREFRKVFAQMRIRNELPEGMDKFQVMNVVTQATKVRIEIMKAIAKIVETDSEIGYVPTYLSRPILHIKEKEGNGGAGARTPRRHIKSLTFADAIEQYGLRLEEKHLTWAYEKASWNFQGQMRQNFVVLGDRAMTGGASGSSGTSGPSRGAWPRGGRARGGTPGMGRGGGKKRPMEETDTEESSRAKKR